MNPRNILNPGRFVFDSRNPCDWSLFIGADASVAPLAPASSSGLQVPWDFVPSELQSIQRSLPRTKKPRLLPPMCRLPEWVCDGWTPLIHVFVKIMSPSGLSLCSSKWSVGYELRAISWYMHTGRPLERAAQIVYRIWSLPCWPDAGLEDKAGGIERQERCKEGISCSLEFHVQWTV